MYGGWKRSWETRETAFSWSRGNASSVSLKKLSSCEEKRMERVPDRILCAGMSGAIIIKGVKGPQYKR